MTDRDWTGSAAGRAAIGSHAAGSDDVDGARRDELVPRECERLRFSFSPGNEPGGLSVVPFPLATRDVLSFRLTCPRFVGDGTVGPCGGRLVVRDATASQGVLGQVRIAHRLRRGEFTVRVMLNELGVAGGWAPARASGRP